jgi:hypothetical protein
MSQSPEPPPTAGVGGTSPSNRFHQPRPHVARTGTPRRRHHGPLLGTASVHTVIDHNFRAAYAEIHTDETADTDINVLHNAVAWFAERWHRRACSVRQRLGLPLSSLARCVHKGRHHPHAHPALLAAIQRQDRRLTPHHVRGWAYARRQAVQPGGTFTTHHPAHRAIGGLPPISRLTKLPGPHS